MGLGTTLASSAAPFSRAAISDGRCSDTVITVSLQALEVVGALTHIRSVAVRRLRWFWLARWCQRWFCPINRKVKRTIVVLT